MTILCIDTSSVTCACAVVRDGEVLAETLINNGLNHSRTLLPAVKKILEEAGVSMADVDNISVTVGPGSFTGVKISAATVKGLAFERNIPCTAVSTLEALAYNRSEDGLVCAVMDARRGMLYNAVFQMKNGVALRVTEDRQISCEDLFNEIVNKDIFITGDGTELFKSFCAEKGFTPVAAEGDSAFVRGYCVYMAAKAAAFRETSHEKLTPEYLRLPQAERERLEKEKGKN